MLVVLFNVFSLMSLQDFTDNYLMQQQPHLHICISVPAFKDMTCSYVSSTVTEFHHISPDVKYHK